MHIATMKIQYLFSLLLCGFLAVFTGCVQTADGHHQAGMPGKDSITSRYNRPLSQVQIAAREVISKRGVLEVDNIVAKTLQARIKECVVFVRLKSLNEKETEVVVQVRSKMGGDVDMAADLQTQIALQLTTL